MRKYLYILYKFGFSAYNPYRALNKSYHYSKRSKIMFSSICLCIFISIILAVCVVMQHMDLTRSIFRDRVFLHLVIGSTYFVTVAHIFQCNLFVGNLENLNRVFLIIEYNLYLKEEKELNYELFKKRYMFKNILNISLYVLTAIFVSIPPILDDIRFSLYLIFAVLIFPSFVVDVHTLFYIEMYHFFWHL